MDDYNKKYLQLDLLGEHVGTKKKPQTIHLLVFVMHHSLVLAGVLLVHLLQLLVALLSNHPTFPEKRQKVFFLYFSCFCKRWTTAKISLKI